MRIGAKKWISGALAAVLLAGSMPVLQAGAVEPALQEEVNVAEAGTEDGADAGWEIQAASYQYVTFPKYGTDVLITVPDETGILPMEYAAATTLYRINVSETEEFVFEAAVRYGSRLEIPEELAGLLVEKQDRVLVGGRWLYRFGLAVSGLSTARTAPMTIRLELSGDVVAVEVDGQAVVSGTDEDGMAQVGSEVSIKVTKPGYVLARMSRDEKGNTVYTAMALDYDNCYTFTVEEQADFAVVDPEKVDYAIVYGDSRKAKLTGEAGIRLSGLASSAQGYKEIVLNFTAVKNGSDGTEDEDVYYEVKVTAMPAEGEEPPAGSGAEPVYYYIPKTRDSNTQSKSVRVNDGDLSAPTACVYEFAVRMVLIDRTVQMPDADTPVEEPVEAALSGNTITKSFATKNLYYEDKLGFTRKKTTIYSGQGNVLAGSVKYSKNASYLHDLTAVAYDGRGAVCEGLACIFENDNDELYISADEDVAPGKYKVVVYAGIGEEATAGSPQGGTMYQANTSFTLTVEAGIWYIDTTGITGQAAVNNKNITFSAVPVGYGYYDDKKAKTQKFTYEVRSAVPAGTGTGYTVTEPADNVKDNVSVNKSGKVTVKKGYYVDPDTRNNYIAIVIKAADFEENKTIGIAYVQIVAATLVPTRMYLADANGNNLGTKVTADRAEGAQVVVLDQNGNNMNQYVTITPGDNARKTAGIYVTQSVVDGSAYLHVRKCSTVTVKATAKDGGKKSKTLKLTIILPSPTNVYCSISNIIYDGFDISEESGFAMNKGVITYKAPRGSVLKLKMGVKIGGWPYYNDWFDWGYTAKNAKVKRDGDYWLITPTAKTAELEVWTKNGSSKVSGTLKLTNTDWKTVYDTPPRVKLIGGKLYTNKYTKLSEIETGHDGKEEVPYQQLTYQYDYGSYDEVRIAAVSKAGPKLFLSDFDPAHRTFILNAEAGNDLKAGSYQYKVAFYRDGVLMCKPAAITVKVNKASPVKLTASYTLDIAKGDCVELKCTPREFLPDFDTRLLNANVGGRANDFNKYFELAYLTDDVTGEAKAVIRFRDTVTDEEKESLKKTSLTGYVKYSYYYGTGYVENATSKLTIKIK